MKSNQQNRLTMFRTVFNLLTENAAAVGTVAALGVAVAELGERITKIASLAKAQEETPTGAVAAKKEAFDAMAQAALAVAGAVRTHASTQKLPELAASVALTATDFSKGRESDRAHRAAKVHATAVAVLPQLATSNVTAATLEDLQSKIAAAEAQIGRPRQATVARKAATSLLPAMFNEATSILENRIDALMLQLRAAHPELYAKYQAARIVVDLSGTHAAAGAPAVPAGVTTLPAAS